MEIVLNKGFLESFFKHNSSNEKKDVFDSFIRFIKNIKRGVKVTCDFDDHDELEAYIDGNPLLHALEEREPEYYLKPDLSYAINQPSFYEEGSRVKMFFLESLVQKENELEGKFGYSFISGLSLDAKWRNFLTSKEINRYFVTNNFQISSEERFDSWSKFNDFKYPLNSIVIADKYILSDKYEQKIAHNLKPLLQELIPNNNLLIQFDVTIIAEQKQCKLSFDMIKADLDNFLKKEIPNTHVNLTLIDYDDELKAFIENKHGTDFHDRRIVTTYYWYEVGKGFNLFKQSVEQKSSLPKIQLKPSNSKLYMGFNFYASNQDDVKLLLEEYGACASVAKNVYGTNLNRLLLPYQFQP